MFYKVLNILWSQFLMDVANISGITIFRCILGGMPLFELKKKLMLLKKKFKKNSSAITEKFGTLCCNVPFTILFITPNSERIKAILRNSCEEKTRLWSQSVQISKRKLDHNFEPSPVNIYWLKVNKKHYKKVWNMFRCNNKSTRTRSLTSFYCWTSYC